MKLFLASDIHGSLTAGQRMLDAWQQSGASHLLLLGDLLNHGPRNAIPEGYAPDKLAERLNQFADAIIAVRGNCDSEVDQMLLDFPLLAEHHTVLLPDGRRLFLTHGHLYHPDNRPPLRSGDVLAFGHIHLPIAEYAEPQVIFNPGSVTIPRGGHPASYGLLDGELLQVKAFDGSVLRELDLSHYPLC